MLVVTLILLGCSGDPEAPAADAPATDAPAVAEDPNTEPPALDKTALQDAAEEATLVPSPTEMQRALSEAGIDKGLSALVPAHEAPTKGEDKDVIAVRVGMDLAYALLTVNDSETPVLVARLHQVKAGMAALGAGTDIGATIDDFVGRLQSDSLSRSDLLSELDEIHGAVIPEIEFEAGERAVPLIQAGSWLAGINLVSTAIVTAEKPEAAAIVRQPQVAAYFLRYVRTEGSTVAPAAVMEKLEATLVDLQTVAAKPALELDDVRKIATDTGNVLALL